MRAKVKKLTAAQSRKRFAALKKAGCKPRRIQLPTGESVVIRKRKCAVATNPKPKKVSIKKTRTTTRVTIKNPDRERHVAALEKLLKRHRIHHPHDHAVAFASKGYTATQIKKHLVRGEMRSSPLGPLHQSARPSKTRKNPRRPPKRWFEHCLASVAGQRHARDPAAICGAVWWRKPPTERARIVRQLERGTPRQRRAAVAIAKAERNRADRRPPPRMGNPPMTDDAALREYERTHWGERGRSRISQAQAPNPHHGTATKLGRLVSLVYLTRKGGDAEPTEYEHEFEGCRPELVYNDGGLMIAGGSYRIREGGIDG